LVLLHLLAVVEVEGQTQLVAPMLVPTVVRAVEVEVLTLVNQVRLAVQERQGKEITVGRHLPLVVVLLLAVVLAVQGQLLVVLSGLVWLHLLRVLQLPMRLVVTVLVQLPLCLELRILVAAVRVLVKPTLVVLAVQE
jgi:hypothetical protein